MHIDQINQGAVDAPSAVEESFSGPVTLSTARGKKKEKKGKTKITEQICSFGRPLLKDRMGRGGGGGMWGYQREHLRGKSLARKESGLIVWRCGKGHKLLACHTPTKKKGK